ncbi:MAG TPA: hypothetical protein VM347_24485, partial [Nonomuraea sp.]|nr:hypothetical protein [Nonomuraea sp.]
MTLKPSPRLAPPSITAPPPLKSSKVRRGKDVSKAVSDGSGMLTGSPNDAAPPTPVNVIMRVAVVDPIVSSFARSMNTS